MQGELHLTLIQDGILAAAFMGGLTVAAIICAELSQRFNAMRLMGKLRTQKFHVIIAVEHDAFASRDSAEIHLAPFNPLLLVGPTSGLEKGAKQTETLQHLLSPMLCSSNLANNVCRGDMMV